MESDYVVIAQIAKPRGLKGEVAADVVTDFPERFDNLIKVFLVGEDGEASEASIEKHWFQKDRVILKFAEIDSIEAAEKLRGANVCIEESEAVSLAEDEYYDWNLIGCEVETVEGEGLGKVKEIFRAGENENLVVGGGAKEYLIPFAKKICVSIDIENKLIVVDPPEGLLEF